jgi:rRNA maturation endonuclease Nob1
MQHYAIPSENLPALAQVGCAKIAMFAFRCGECGCDFHIDRKPGFCPECGSEFTLETKFGSEDRA